MKLLKKDKNIWCFCVFGKITQKHTNTLALWCNSIAEKKTKKFGHCVLCFLEGKKNKNTLEKEQPYCWKKETKTHLVIFFSSEKNTKTHWLSGAILLLKKRPNKLGQFFCVFRKKQQHKNTRTHRLSGAILILKEDKETFGHCVFVFFEEEKNTKNTLGVWCNLCGGNHKIA